MNKSEARNDAFAVRVLASEGRYHLYRLLAEKRLFLGAKLALVAVRHWRGVGTRPRTNQIALINGENQLRYHRNSAEMSTARLGDIEAFANYNPTSDLPLFPRIKTTSLVTLLLLVLRVLFLGRRRDLSLYLLAFFRATKDIVQEQLSDVKVLVCYNDQPFDVAALVHALNQRGGCRTIVIQHGLILSPTFYFPSIAKEFWAWGSLSQDYFATRHPEGRLVITGRYHDDAAIKSDGFLDLSRTPKIKTLIAFSFFHDEIIRGLHEILRQRRKMSQNMAITVQFNIKLHPALKNERRIRAMIAKSFGWITVVDGDMEELVVQHDNLITSSSTSAVDFLLVGKGVYFLAPNETADFPSLDYGFSLSDFLARDTHGLAKKNHMRLRFLKKALHI